MAVDPPTQLMLYIIHRSPPERFLLSNQWLLCLRALCHCALSSVFLHIFPFPPFSCPSTPPPIPHSLHSRLARPSRPRDRTLNHPLGRHPRPSPLLSSPLLSSLLRRRRSSPSAWPSSLSPPPPFSLPPLVSRRWWVRPLRLLLSPAHPTSHRPLRRRR